MASSARAHTNLELFLRSTTPALVSQSLPKSCIGGLNSMWQPLGTDRVDYFTLGELWKCYDECSAYGIGTAVFLDSGERVMQYLVPYLSAIQIYTNGTSAASSDDSESSDKLSRSLSNNSSKNWDAASEESVDQDKLGSLYFQYCELDAPHGRTPLSVKITELARKYPGLLTLKSVELSPASWMAIYWCPIYHIPAQKNMKDFATCFLTYHTLSSSFQDTVGEYDDKNGGKKIYFSEVVKRIGSKKSTEDGSSGISLPPFDLAGSKKSTEDDGSSGISLPSFGLAGSEKSTENGSGGISLPLFGLAGSEKSTANGSGGIFLPPSGLAGSEKSTENGSSRIFLPPSGLAGSEKSTENGSSRIFPSFGLAGSEKSTENGSSGISFPPFGLVTYRMQKNIWIKPETSDPETMSHLHSAADCWLKQLNFNHHDFNFFMS